MQDEEGETPPPVAEASLVHNGINCDGCGMGPLRGIRYKVLVCLCVCVSRVCVCVHRPSRPT